MEIIALVWNTFILDPLLNGLVFLYAVLGRNFGITILVFTIIVRLATLPLTLRQIRSTQKMTALQPKLKVIQQRYAKDRARLSQETMKLYRESGGQPHRMPGAPCHSVPHLDRTVHGDYSGASHQPRITGGTLGAPLLLAAPGKPGGAAEQQLPWPGSGGGRKLSNHLCHGCTGGRLHVGHAEDEHSLGCGPSPGIHQPHAALDDADNVWLLHTVPSRRVAALLAGFQPHWNSHSILCNRMGRPSAISHRACYSYSIRGRRSIRYGRRPFS